jgi:hypothetical protein
LQATRIAKLPAATAPEGFFHCVLRDLDPAGKTARGGGLIVSFGLATVTGALAAGCRVEVHGRLTGRTLHASWVKVEPLLEDLDGPAFEICGPISGFDPVARTFQVMRVRVDYSQAKVDGTLANGVSVLVELPHAGSNAAGEEGAKVLVGANRAGEAMSARAEASNSARSVGQGQRRV